LWAKNYQVKYPTPEAGKPIDEADLFAQFTAFLDQHGNDIGVLLIEPQWGSSQAAFPWPKELLKTYIKMAQDRGIKVCADEIMCGLGRHGHGTLFVSKAWDLNPDAITFGKAIAGGAYPLSGAIMKRGRDVLTLHGRSVMQSHTFAGSSQRALMAGTDVLNELSTWMPSITKLGGEMCHIFSYLEKISKGMLVCHGQGLMWGGLFSKIGQSANGDYRADAFDCFMKHADNIGVLPYFVPAGGFMVTPVVDIDVGTVYEIGEKLAEVVERTMADMNWEPQSQTPENTLSVSQQVSNAIEPKCLPSLHATKSCTSCTSFVCQERRRRFVSFQ
jgi:adenosylmethionine-8-amino-7-oxononanoate aminotransferase